MQLEIEQKLGCAGGKFNFFKVTELKARININPYIFPALLLLRKAANVALNKEQIELLQLDKAGIKVAEYLTELPGKKLLQQKLHEAIKISKQHLENFGKNDEDLVTGS